MTNYSVLQSYSLCGSFLKDVPNLRNVGHLLSYKRRDKLCFISTFILIIYAYLLSFCIICNSYFFITPAL